MPGRPAEHALLIITNAHGQREIGPDPGLRAIPPQMATTRLVDLTTGPNAKVATASYRAAAIRANAVGQVIPFSIAQPTDVGADAIVVLSMGEA